MINLGNIESVLLKIEPHVIAKFLVYKGYSRVGYKEGMAEVYANKKDEHILLPLRQDEPDYSRRILEISQLFVDKHTTLDDVVGTIVLPNSDIFRYRIETLDSAWGQLRLDYTHEAMHALYDMLQYTAAGVSTQRTDYKNVSESAKLFAQQCKFGQTEYGSFVLKVFCPTNPIGAARDHDEPFGRMTTKAVIENLNFLSNERSEDPSEPLPPTLNRNVAKAVWRLRPESSLNAVTEVQMRYNTLSDSSVGLIGKRDDDEDKIAVLDLGPFVYSRAENVVERLRRAGEYARESLRGHITDLHKDRPVRAEEQSHEVTLEVKYGASWRQLRVRLLPKQYRDAMVWQDQDLLIDVDALVDKRSRVWSVSQLYSIAPVDKNHEEANLFDVIPRNKPE